MKTIIYSTHINSNYIELQYESIKKFFKSEFEYIVFNDAPDIASKVTYNEIHTEKINEICEKLNIKCIKIPQELHNNRDKVLPESFVNAGDHYVYRCALAVQYGFNYIINNYSDCYLFLIDSDMFFINDFDINTYMANKDLAGMLQSRSDVYYLWNGIFMCNLKECKDIHTFNWEAGRVNILDNEDNKTEITHATDVGGHNYYYLKKHKYLKGLENSHRYKGISNIHTTDANLPVLIDKRSENLLSELINISSPPSPHPEYANKEFILDFSVIHLRGGGGWCYHQKEYHLLCCDIIRKYINM